MANLEKKSFDNPDELKAPEKTNAAVVNFGTVAASRVILQPGWKWSEDVGPDIGKPYCDVEHVGMVVSGSATASFPDGGTTVMKAGDIFYVPSRPHDSWVVGDEPYVSIHFLGANSYAK